MINLQRVETDLKTLACYSADDQGVTRFSYSSQDVVARNYLTEILTDLSFELHYDFAGNVLAYNKLAKTESPIVMGSHIDSVKNGGAYDGVLGVVSALEVLRDLKETDQLENYPLALLIFVEEEGSVFGGTTMGSKYLVGEYSKDDLICKKDLNGEPFESQRASLKKADVLSFYDFVKSSRAMLELHIEQGPVLESLGLPIGIVEGIVGTRNVDVKLYGVANHAGTTQMQYRKDPVPTFCKIQLALYDVLKEYGAKNTTLTCGRIDVVPNASNVIANRLRFSLDYRDLDNGILENLHRQIVAKVKVIAAQAGIDCTLDVLAVSDGVALDGGIVNGLTKTAQTLKIPHIKMPSGAVHDAALMAKIVPTGMIFVRSKEGKSHCAEEYSSMEDIAQGIALMKAWLLKEFNHGG